MGVALTASLKVDGIARAQFVRLCALAALAYCSYAICRTPLLPLLARDLGADAPAVGLVVGASTLTGIAIKLPAGALSDVVGRRTLLIAGALVFATMPFTYLGVASVAVLIGLRFVHGLATAIVGPVASATVSEIAPTDRRGAWLSTYGAVQGAGQALGPVVGGYLLAMGVYDLAFLTAGVMAAATPLIAAGWPATVPVRDAKPKIAAFGQGIREVCGHPLILVTSLAQAGQLALNSSLNAFLPLFARDMLHVGPAQLGWLFAIQTTTTLATRPVMGALSDRVGRLRLIIAGLATCSTSVTAVSFATSPALLVGGMVVYAIGVASTTSATSALITDLARRARYGAAHGVFGTLYDVGDAFGPIAAGFLVAAVGYGGTFRTMAALALACGAMFYAVSRQLPVEGRGIVIPGGR
jgi:MFS transporter, DHA1 family, multidrug resistance protein